MYKGRTHTFDEPDYSGTLSGSLKAEFDTGSVTLVKQTATLVVRTFTS